jgi:outer membrane protein assembly factor BamB
MKRLTTAFAVLASIAAGGACGSTGGFGLTSDDNRPERLRAAFDRATPPPAGAPINAQGKHMVYVVSGSKSKATVTAFDLDAGKTTWTVDGVVKSRVVSGSKFVAFVGDGGQLSGYDQATGKRLWTTNIGSSFLGLASDRERVFYVSKTGSSTWTLVALDGSSGSQLWSAPSPGQLGTPAARGGLVFSPFLKQWLVVLDARTGEQLARIRGIDEEIVFVRDTTAEVYFGSKTGVFLLDERAASGKRASSTYGSANLPKEFVRSFYHWDAFDAVQAGYSAYDRNRILWRASAAGDALQFRDDRVVVHNFRFFFGFDAKTGALAWAYNHPRYDAVASDHLGAAIGFVSQDEIGALDPGSGAKVSSMKLSVPGSVRGATFDADGWAPKGGGEAVDTAKALVSIARDRDARFLDVKLFALAALGNMTGGDVAADLLALVQDGKTPPKVYDKAVQVLVARKDVAGLPAMVKALAVEHNYITGTAPKGVGVVAQAVAAMGDLSKNDKVDASTRGALVEGLVAHLFDPQTPAPELTPIVKALGASRLPGSLSPLRRFLLTYRADPTFSTQVAAVGATIDALLNSGGVAERELVAFVAEDTRTQAGVAEYAAQALRQHDLKRQKKTKPDKKANAGSASAGTASK